jgi:hypothetical protein
MLTSKGTLRQVFIRVYKLDIRTASNILSGSTLPPPSSLCEISTLYTRIQCVRGGGGWGSGPQTDKHLPQSPFTDHFLNDDILHCLL